MIELLRHGFCGYYGESKDPDWKREERRREKKESRVPVKLYKKVYTEDSTATTAL